MKAISLCSGADGFGLAAQLLGIEVVAHVEIETIFDEHYKRHWPNAKRFYDLRTLNPADLPDADIIFGGEPCQPHSKAGNKQGMSDDNYLWPYYFNVCKIKQSSWIINENVNGSVNNMVLDTKIADLESIDYSTRQFDIPACAVGTPHERKRIWLLANSNSQRLVKDVNVSLRKGETLMDEIQNKTLGEEHFLTKSHRGSSGRIFKGPIGGIHPVAYDVPTELALIKAYGNAVVPWIPYIILKCILEIEKLK